MKVRNEITDKAKMVKKTQIMRKSLGNRGLSLILRASIKDLIVTFKFFLRLDY